MIMIQPMGEGLRARSWQRTFCRLAVIACGVALSGATAHAQLSLPWAPAKPKAATPQQQPGAAAPSSVTAAKLTVQAAQLMQQRKDDEALPLLDKALALDPKLVPALRLRVFVRLSKNQRPQALADLAELIKLAPKDATTLVTRGTVLAGNKQYDAALADFDRALVIDPRSEEHTSELQSLRHLVCRLLLEKKKKKKK